MPPAAQFIMQKMKRTKLVHLHNATGNRADIEAQKAEFCGPKKQHDVRSKKSGSATGVALHHMLRPLRIVASLCVLNQRLDPARKGYEP